VRHRNRLVSLFSVAAAAGMLLFSAAPALAAGGGFSVGTAGISLFGRTRIAAGETFTAASGAQVPAVVTYTDAAGKTTNYIAAQKLPELFDVSSLAWDSENSCVAFAPPSTGITVVVDGEVVQRTGDGGGVTITVGGDPDPATGVTEQPVLGAVKGTFTEIDPSAVDTTRQVVYFSDGMTVQSKNGLNRQRVSVGAVDSIVFAITNNGTTDQEMNLWRPFAVSEGGGQHFKTVKIAPGKTLTRALTCSQDADELHRELEWTVDSSLRDDDAATNITVTVKEYQYAYAA